MRYSAVGNANTVQLFLNHLEFLKYTDAKGKVVQTDFFLLIWPWLAIIGNA